MKRSRTSVQYRNQTEIATLMLFINTVPQRTKIATLMLYINTVSQRTKIATSSSILKNYRNDPNSRNSKLYTATVSQRTKNRNHQLGIENYRNDLNSRISKLFIDTVSHRFKKIATTRSILKVIATSPIVATLSSLLTPYRNEHKKLQL